MKKFKFTPNWILFLSLAGFLGAILRLIYVQDMEYKEDEEYNFIQTQLIGARQPWPWYGIPSGVYVVNPGMSIWVFTILAKLFGIHHPTALAHAVQSFALLGICMILPFAVKFLKQEEKRIWLWAYALAMVNPFLILYQRKLWPEPFLPFFTMITLMGWWKRTRRLGAFFWGMVGAWLGQIHMSGFFFSASLFLWTVFFKPQTVSLDRVKNPLKGTEWKYWFLGSGVGALPLIPWLAYILQHPAGGTIVTGWGEAIQLKYWAFWFSDPIGLHLGNPLGLLRGPSHWNQISDFVRYPLWNGHATYAVGAAHITTALCTLAIFSRGIQYFYQRIKNTKKAREKNAYLIEEILLGQDSETAFVQNAALWGCGIMLTLTGVMIRRYYMAVTFPLEFICLIRMARPTSSKWGQQTLAALWLSELVISASFVHYIHVNEGSVQGDYGRAYHLIQSVTQPVIQPIAQPLTHPVVQSIQHPSLPLNPMSPTN